MSFEMWYKGSKVMNIFHVYTCIGIITLLVTVTSGTQANDYCSLAEVQNAKNECHDVYAGGHHGHIAVICQNLECYLQCLTDAIGHCYTRSMFFREDIEVYKVLYRARCANLTLSRLAEEYCHIQTPCIDDQFRTELVKTLTNISDDTEMKQLECRSVSTSKGCLSVTPNNSCTAEMAALQESFGMVKNSLFQCNIPQDHPFFAEYGADIKCLDSKIKSNCFTASVMSRISRCTPVTLEKFMSEDSSVADKICNDMECTSQCYFEAMGECHKLDQYVMLDPEMIKVSTRAACDNLKVLRSTMNGCRMKDDMCLNDLGKSLTIAHSLIQHQKYSDYKKTICNATAQFRSCIVFGVSTNCTEEMATLAKDMFEVWHSYAGCGLYDTSLYKKYNSSLECGESSKGSLMTLTFVDLALLCCLVYAIVMLLASDNEYS